MSLKQLVKNAIVNVLNNFHNEGFLSSEFNAENLKFNITEPNIPEKMNQDQVVYNYSTNIAFLLKQYVKAAPFTIAEKVASELAKDDLFVRVDVSMPGFINIVLSPKAFEFVLLEIAKNKHLYGGSYINKTPINVEFVSANPTGFLHVGHARGAAFGDSLVRVLRHAGYDVEAEYYVNDAGNQINILEASARVRYLELFGIQTEMPEDCYRGNDIIWAAQQIKDQYGDYFVEYNETKREEFKTIATKILLDKIKSDLNDFNVSFNTFSSEKKLKDDGLIQPVIEKLKPNCYTQDGALFLKTTEYGDDKDRVLIKSDGSYTYLTPDIAYHKTKFDKCDKLINIWGADHSGYIARMKIAMQCLGYNPDNLDVLTIQLVRLIKDGQEFKMSKRAGTSVTLADLLDVSNSDVIRFMMLTREINNKFDFDIDFANSHDSNNPVYIVQYAHSRTVSLLEKLKEPKFDENVQLTEKAKKVILHLDEFVEIIKTIVNTSKVNLMTQYLIDLAKVFNSFYAETKLIGNEFEAAYALLVKDVQTVLRLGLSLIGVSAPDSM
ncbi:arginine--tRNA ligase [Mycoplasma sp. Pen4]|uniref:arginine--tRNA ligase n=1 Tax=Mycoplasma sp. Pen4 TaxID=640330 RepID=UPI00165439A7|nr:arginine--tRNA ligase [Mycoplasma sp. Pen4]QNM93360.1 arginine--tRNA ligase [Mycoplasma sp. Pen4]